MVSNNTKRMKRTSGRARAAVVKFSQHMMQRLSNHNQVAFQPCDFEEDGDISDPEFIFTVDWPEFVNSSPELAGAHKLEHLPESIGSPQSAGSDSSDSFIFSTEVDHDQNLNGAEEVASVSDSIPPRFTGCNSPAFDEWFFQDPRVVVDAQSQADDDKTPAPEQHVTLEPGEPSTGKEKRSAIDETLKVRQLLRAELRVQCYDLLRSQVEELDPPCDEEKTITLKWRDSETQEFDKEKAPSSLRKSRCGFSRGASNLLPIPELDEQENAYEDECRFDFTDSRKYLIKVIDAASYLIESEMGYTYDQMDYLFQIALEQARTACVNYSEGMAKISRGFKLLNLTTHKMIGTQLRMSELLELMFLESTDVFLLERELFLCLVDCEMIRTELMAIRDNHEDTIAFFELHLEDIVDSLLEVVEVAQKLDTLYLRFLSKYSESLTDDQLSFPCFSDYTRYVAIVKQSNLKLIGNVVMKDCKKLVASHFQLEKVVTLLHDRCQEAVTLLYENR